jgi:hypothetical protein
MASMPSHSHGHRRVDTQADSQVAAVADQTGRVHRRRGGRWSHPVRGGLHPPRPVRPGRADPGAAGGAPGRDDGAGRRRRPTAPPCRCRPPSIAQPAAQVPDHKALARLPGPATRTPRDLESATTAALGPWPGAGGTCRRNWTPWMSSSQAGQPGRTSAVARPGMAWTPPGSCWDGRRQPGRLGSEAALARLWGGPAARLLGRTDRHRLNRGGSPRQPCLVAHHPGPHALPCGLPPGRWTPGLCGRGRWWRAESRADQARVRAVAPGGGPAAPRSAGREVVGQRGGR